MGDVEDGNLVGDGVGDVGNGVEDGNWSDLDSIASVFETASSEMASEMLATVSKTAFVVRW